MNINRRDMMTTAAAFTMLAATTDPKAFAEAIQQAPSNTVDVADYWTNFYDDTLHTRGPNGAPLADPKKKTVYLHSPSSNEALQYANTIAINQLNPLKGDVLVKMAISQFRAGKGDVSEDVSHFRIDATQSFDSMNIIAPLSWAAIASITPDKQLANLPTIDKFGFNQQGQASSDQINLKQIVLPSGVGKLAVNVTRPANAEMIKIVESASLTVTTVLSMMTLPAISVPAIKVFSQLFGKWQSHASIVMNGNLTPVIGTSLPVNADLMPQDPMPLTSGYYVMFPKQHQDELDAEFKNLTIMNGFLVHKDAQEPDLEKRAKNAVPGVSYATLRIYTGAAPAASGGCAAKPQG